MCMARAQTEIDCLAVRHPHHNQDEREVGFAKFLGDFDPSLTDLVICEVKSDPKLQSFNGPIKRDDLIALSAVLNWAGVFEKGTVHSVAEKLRPFFEDGVKTAEALRGVTVGKVRVRALFCCPPMDERDVTGWWLTSEEIFRYAKECFSPSAPRAGCSARYNFLQWGRSLEPIVRWVKETPKEQISLAGLYKHLGVK